MSIEYIDLGIHAIYKADVWEGKKPLTKLFCQKHSCLFFFPEGRLAVQTCTVQETQILGVSLMIAAQAPDELMGITRLWVLLRSASFF